MYTVDLNSDLGESFGNYKIGNDDKIIPLISSANVACGYHASTSAAVTVWSLLFFKYSSIFLRLASSALQFLI